MSNQPHPSQEGGDTKPDPNAGPFPERPPPNSQNSQHGQGYTSRQNRQPSQSTYEDSTDGSDAPSPAPSHHLGTPDYSHQQHYSSSYHASYTQTPQQQAYRRTSSEQQPYMPTSGHATGGPNGYDYQRVTIPTERRWSAWSEWRLNTVHNRWYRVRQDAQGEQDYEWS